MATRHLQLFRNTTPFESYEAAVAYLNSGNAPVLQDGTPILARYYTDEAPHQASSVKSLLGIRYIAGSDPLSATKTMTIINGDIDESKVNELIEEYISENLNYTDTPVQDEFVTAVDMSGGTLEISRAAISAEQISLDSVVFSATNVADALDEVKDDIANLESDLTDDLTLSAATSVDQMSYILYQGDKRIVTINIPKDMVVSSGEVITADGTEKQGTSESAESAGLTAGEKYMKLQLANADDKHNLVYVNVKDLADEYTVETGATQVQLAISSGNVISATIVAGSIDTQELADGAVTSDKIASGAVGTEQIADGAITEDKIDDEAVTSDKIASGAVGTEQIANGAITEDKIDDEAVTSEKIAVGAVGTDQIADSAITEDKIADGAVTSDKIASGAVGTEQIADGAITADKLDPEVQDDLDDYLKIVKVNGVSAEPSNHVEEITIYTDDLYVGEGVPGSEIVSSGASLNNILAFFEDKIISATSGVLSTVKFNNVISTEEAEGTIAKLEVYASDLTVGDDYEPETAYTQITSADTVQTAIAKLDAAVNDAVDVVSGNGINISAVPGTNDKRVSVNLSSDGTKQTASAVTASGLDFDTDGGLYLVGLDAGTYTIE